MSVRGFLRRGPLVAFAVIGLGALWGCSSDSPSVLDPHSPQARRISHLFWLMLGLAAGVYVLVMAFVLFALRHSTRSRPSGPPPGPPEETPATRQRGNWFILLGGLAMPIVVLSVVAVSTVGTTRALETRSGVVHITVDAQQWWWRLTYPDAHVVTANEIHVPVGQPVELTLLSDNVIHSVWVPQLNGKTDVIPGQPNHMNFTAEKPGRYRGQCAEFCGIGHARMAFVVIAQPQADYRRWLQDNAATPAPPTEAVASQGQQVFVNGSCAGCHTVAGTKATGTFGPDLTHFGSRTSIAALTLPNDPGNLARWLDHTQDVKPGALMPDIDLTPDQIKQLVAYLEGLK